MQITDWDFQITQKTKPLDTSSLSRLHSEKERFTARFWSYFEFTVRRLEDLEQKLDYTGY